jgi:phosphoribosyl 1,2-cyclic phosphodiesterase
MKVTLWGTRGSLACPGPETTHYGGNTSCVQVEAEDGTLLVLDAGTGIRRLGTALSPDLPRIDILLTHLHLDHIEGLGFFGPLYSPKTEVHIWGPRNTRLSLRDRLMRYLSPPLFPVHLRDLPALTLHDLPLEEFQIGAFQIEASLVCHPGPTVGFRIKTASDSPVLAYLPDHEPALGAKTFPLPGDWTSGYATASGADVLIHDAQYSSDEYAAHVGWGHSSWKHALDFAVLTGAKQLVTFHHDPLHSDQNIDALCSEVSALATGIPIVPAVEGTSFELN